MMEDDKNNLEVKALLDKNHMLYARPPSTNICVSSTHHVDYANSGSYQNSVPLILDSSISGNVFVDGRNSYLRLDISVVNPSKDTESIDVMLPPSGVAGLIESVVITSRNVEVSRIEDFNLLSLYKQYWEHGDDIVSGSDCEGLINQTQISTGAVTLDKKDVPLIKARTSGGTAKTFCIPLSKLSPLFDTEQLLPPHLMSSLRIVINWTPATRAFSTNIATVSNPSNVNVSAQPTSYNIINSRMTWKTYTIADQYARKISEICAKQGLFFPIFQYFSSNSTTNSAQVNFRVEKSASRALQLMVIEVDPTLYAASAQLSTQPLSSMTFSTKSFQAHAGNVYFPVNKITTTNNAVATIDNIAEFMQYTKMAMGNKSSLSKRSFFQAGSVSNAFQYYPALGMMAVDLRLNNNSESAGIQINSSVSLLVDYESAATLKSTYRFLKYLRLINIFSNNIKIEE